MHPTRSNIQASNQAGVESRKEGIPAVMQRSATSHSPAVPGMVSTLTIPSESSGSSGPAVSENDREQTDGVVFHSNVARSKRASIASLPETVDTSLLDLVRPPRRSSDSAAGGTSHFIPGSLEVDPVSETAVSNELIQSIHLARTLFETAGLDDSGGATSDLSQEQPPELSDSEQDTNEPVRDDNAVVLEDDAAENGGILEFWLGMADIEPISPNDGSLGDSSDSHLLESLADGDHLL